jgi:hypothetical protein
LLVKGGASSGAHRVANAGGIQIVECVDAQNSEALVASFVAYDLLGNIQRGHEVALEDAVQAYDAVEAELL